MTEYESQTTAAAALRHLAQAVQSLDAETPRIEIGSLDVIGRIEDKVGLALPNDVRQLYLDSNPAALSVPMPADDVEFAPLGEISGLCDELSLDEGLIPIALEGGAPYVIDLRSGNIKIGTRTSTGWEWETVALSLSDFLSALAAIAEAFAATTGETLATRFEIGTEAEIQLEKRLSAIDPEHADSWMEWLA